MYSPLGGSNKSEERKTKSEKRNDYRILLFPNHFSLLSFLFSLSKSGM